MMPECLELAKTKDKRQFWLDFFDFNLIIIVRLPSLSLLNLLNRNVFISVLIERIITESD
jgi:hypothetical protein